MQHAVHNRATIRAADRTEVSGRVTADEVNLDRFHERISKARALVAAILILPALAYAQNNQGDNQIAALQAQITALRNQVNTLQTQLAAVQSNNALKLGPFVGVVSGLVDGVNGPHIYFTGANIHIVSGSTTTQDSVTGLGNLIIGYDEAPPDLSPGDRGGSHNLVIGRYHRFTQAAFGGLLAGEGNFISAEGASVSGGTGNFATSTWASVSGGVANTASTNQGTSVSGGSENHATGLNASVSGGKFNIASGDYSSVVGGRINTAGGFFTVILGSNGVTDNTDFSIAPQPPFP
jgi:hypothetical protein